MLVFYGANFTRLHDVKNSGQEYFLYKVFFFFLKQEVKIIKLLINLLMINLNSSRKNALLPKWLLHSKPATDSNT